MFAKVARLGPAVQTLLRRLWDAVRDLLPIILVILAFQALVLRQPLPNLGETLIGVSFVHVGLMLFVQGLEMGLFPLGESMAFAFASKGSLACLCSSSYM